MKGAPRPLSRYRLSWRTPSGLSMVSRGDSLTCTDFSPSRRTRGNRQRCFTAEDLGQEGHGGVSDLRCVAHAREKSPQPGFSDRRVNRIVLGRVHPAGKWRHGAVAQLGERCVRNAEVEGSTPFRSTRKALFATPADEAFSLGFVGFPSLPRRTARSSACPDATTGNDTDCPRSPMFGATTGATKLFSVAPPNAACLGFAVTLRSSVPVARTPP